MYSRNTSFFGLWSKTQPRYFFTLIHKCITCTTTEIEWQVLFIDECTIFYFSELWIALILIKWCQLRTKFRLWIKNQMPDVYWHRYYPIHQRSTFDSEAWTHKNHLLEFLAHKRIQNWFHSSLKYLITYMELKKTHH